MKVGAYLQVTMKISAARRPAAAGIFFKYRNAFLNTIPGAMTKELLVRDEDVQVLHGFESVEAASSYLDSRLFKEDVVTGLQPLWDAAPEVRIFKTA